MTKESLLLGQHMRGYLPLYYRSYEGEERAGTCHQEGFWVEAPPLAGSFVVNIGISCSNGRMACFPRHRIA
jgi:hypothetical protein